MVLEVASSAVEPEGRAVESEGDGGDPAGTESTPLSCKTEPASGCSALRRTSGPTRRSSKGGWTEEEDEILAKAVKHYNGKNWKKIAELFPGRKDVQCLHRWQKVLNPELVKGTWTKEEDDCIIEQVQKHGCKKWAVIAKSLPGRIGKQCRERWHNHLNPEIKRDAWTKEEEIILIRAHNSYGNRWAEIAKYLPGRADNAIKNHWHCSVKKKLQSYISRGVLDQQSGAATSLNKNLYREEFPKINDSQSLHPQSQQASETIIGILSENSLHISPISHSQDVDAKHIKLEMSVSSEFESTVSEKLQHTPEGLLGNAFLESDSAVDGRSSIEDNCSTLSVSLFNNARPAGDSNPCTPRHSVIRSLDNPFCPQQISDVDGSSWNTDVSYPESDIKIFSPHISTPPDLSLGLSLSGSSPESILRSAAKSFKNTPSILRKRRHNCLFSPEESAQGVLADSRDFDDVPDSVDTTLKLATSHLLENTDTPTNLGSLESRNVGQLCMSSEGLLKAKTAPAMKSIEKRLEYEFDIEQNDANAASLGCTLLNLQGAPSRKYSGFDDCAYGSRPSQKH